MLGDEDLVPFAKYAQAAESLGKPSSAARALFGGAEHIERVDCLVRRIAGQQGLQEEDRFGRGLAKVGVQFSNCATANRAERMSTVAPNCGSATRMLTSTSPFV